MQPHLSKCFDNMKKIAFTDEKNSKEIIGMYSSENEYVEFNESVFAHGAVEHWLKRIETAMQTSLFVLTKNAWKQYPEDITQRKEWLLNYPA